MDNSIRSKFDEQIGQPVDVVYSLTVQKINKYGKLQRRIIVLGNFSMFTLKISGSGGKKKVSIQRQDQLYNMIELKVTDQEITILFPDFQLRVVAELGTAMELIRNVFREYAKLTNKCLDSTVATFSGKFSGDIITSASLAEAIQLQMSESAGFAHRFNASCRFFNAKPSYEYRTNLIAAFDASLRVPEQERVLCINELQYPYLDIHTVQALFKALFYGMFFTKVLIHNVNIKDIGMIAALEAISRFPSVRLFELQKVGATIASVPALRNALMRPSGFESFDISGNELEEDGMLVVAEVMMNWSIPLKRLSVARLRSMQLGTGRFAAAIFNNNAVVSTLKSLDISGNAVGAAASDNLLRYFESPLCCLEHIQLNNCQLGAEAMVVVAAARCPTMVDLNISRNPISDSVGLQLCAEIARSSSLQRIDISYMKLDPQVVEAIVAAAFRTANKSSMAMIVTGNDLGTNVAAKMASLLSSSASIREFHADHCEFGQSGVRWIMKCLAGRPIEKLAVAGNIIEGERRSKHEADEFAEALVAFIKETNTIGELSLADNSTARAPIDFIPMMATINEGHAQSLRALDLQGNAIGDGGIIAIADHLARNTSLTTLHIDHNNTKINGFQSLMKALDTNTTLINMPFPARDYKCAMATIGVNQDHLRNIPGTIDSQLARNRAILG